jgi:hypothetical protein
LGASGMEITENYALVVGNDPVVRAGVKEIPGHV